MLKIPYGISDYKVLQEEDYYYVDKTMYLEKLESIGKVLTYLRPGRYGKTLFTSMLSYYYDVNAKEEFPSLFKNTYVEKNPTKNKNNYYILKFDFSGMTSGEKDYSAIEMEFKNKIISAVSRFNEYYQVQIQVNSEKTPNGMLLEFLDGFNTLRLNHKLYILIDEYDNFTNAILEGTGEKFKSIVGNEGFVKSFYAVIKEYCGLGIIDRVFITGICPITLDSMTTGFNIATDISRDIRFHSMIGLTHEEVKKLLQEMDCKDEKQVFDIMLKNYDGYLFHKNAESRIFNATLVMYFLKNYCDFDQIPEELIDVNIAFNYGKLGNLLRLQENNYYLDIIDSLLKTREITGELKPKFNLEVDFTRDDIISLLYYFGYLTIDKMDTITNKMIFRIPNYVMSNLYQDYFLKLLSDAQIELDSVVIDNAIKEIILEGKIEQISQYISNILQHHNSRIFRNFDEKYIQVLYYALLFKNNNYHIYSEYPCKNGYVDLMILRNSDLCKWDIMIELKYLKREEWRKHKKLLEEKKKEAILQLNHYQEDERIKKDTLRKYVVIFVGSKLKVLEEVER